MTTRYPRSTTNPNVPADAFLLAEVPQERGVWTYFLLRGSFCRVTSLSDPLVTYVPYKEVRRYTHETLTQLQERLPGRHDQYTTIRTYPRCTDNPNVPLGAFLIAECDHRITYYATDATTYKVPYRPFPSTPQPVPERELHTLLGPHLRPFRVWRKSKLPIDKA